jgi:hypothetical protein
MITTQSQFTHTSVATALHSTRHPRRSRCTGRVHTSDHSRNHQSSRPLQSWLCHAVLLHTWRCMARPASGSGTTLTRSPCRHSCALSTPPSVTCDSRSVFGACSQSAGPPAGVCRRPRLCQRLPSLAAVHASVVVVRVPAIALHALATAHACTRFVSCRAPHCSLSPHSHACTRTQCRCCV